jgi:hypothetical protein
MFVEDLRVIKPSTFGPYTTIQAAIQAALIASPPQSVVITADYAGTDTYTNVSGVTVLDLRTGAANTGLFVGVGNNQVIIGSSSPAGTGITVGGKPSGIVAVAAAAAPITAAAGGTFVTTLNLPGGANAPFEQVPFTVKASGYITFPAGTYTASIQPLLYAAAGAGGYTASAAAAIYSAAATAITFASATLPVTKPYSIEAHLIGSTTGNYLTGFTMGTGFVGGAALNNATLADTIISNPVTVFTATAAIPVQFLFGFTNSAGFPATGVINLGSFFIEA